MLRFRPQDLTEDGLCGMASRYSLQTIHLLQENTHETLTKTLRSSDVARRAVLLGAGWRNHDLGSGTATATTTSISDSY
jgi:hypothetical protein